MSSSNKEGNNGKRTSPNHRAGAAEPDNVPELINLSDDDAAADSVENARRGWRHTRRSRPERHRNATDDVNSSVADRNSRYNEIDGNDSPPPLLDDDDDYVEMAPVAATGGSSHGRGRHTRSGHARGGGRDADQGATVFVNMFGLRPTHYCHQCRRSVTIDPSSTAIECPECHGSFVEEINTTAFEMEPAPHRRRAQGGNHEDDDEDDDADPHGMGNFANILSNLMGGPPRVRRRGEASSSNSRRSASVGGGGGRHFIRVGAAGPDGQRLGGENGPEIAMEFNGEMDIAQFMQQVIGAMTGRAGGGAGGNLFGGDYVFSNEGFDQVMSQLLEQLGTMGSVPPLNKDALDKIPTTTPPQSALDANENCIICFEPYKPDDQCKRLPCEHLFHTECISKWLSMHGTCPICRDDLSKKYNPNGGNAAGGSGANETSGAAGSGSGTASAAPAGSANQHSSAGNTNPSPFSNFQFQPFTSAVFVADSNGNLRAVRPPQQQQPSGSSAQQQPSNSFLSPNASQQQQPAAGHDQTDGSAASPLMRFAGGLFRTIRGAMTGDNHNQAADPNNSVTSNSAASSASAPSIYPTLPTRSPATGFDVDMPIAAASSSSNAAPRSDDARRRAAEAAAARAASGGASSSEDADRKDVAHGELLNAATADVQSGKRHKPGDGSKSEKDKKLQFDDLD